MRKHGNIKPVATDKRSNYLVSEPNYILQSFRQKNLLTIEMKKTLNRQE